MKNQLTFWEPLCWEPRPVGTRRINDQSVQPPGSVRTRGSPHVRASTRAGRTHTHFHTSERTHFHTKADTHTQTQTHRAAQEVERGWLVSQRLLVPFPGSSKRGVSRCPWERPLALAASKEPAVAQLTPPSACECVHEWVNGSQYGTALWVSNG